MKGIFFKILSLSDFAAKDEIEQKALLVKYRIYIEGQSEMVPFNFDKFQFWRGSDNYPTYLGKDFQIDQVNYKLNEEFLDEVFDNWVEYFKDHSLTKIDEIVETTELQVESSDESVILEIRNQDTLNYNASLSEKIFKELHSLDIEDTQSHFLVLKKYLSLNWYDLSDYLFGLNNIGNFHIQANYWSYILLTKKRAITDKDRRTGKTDTKLSLPKSIAILNEIGFFDLEYYKSLTLEKRNKLVALILDLDHNNKTILRSIQGNTSVLINPNSNEDFGKYTANRHEESIKKDLLKLIS